MLNHTSDQHPWFLESKSSRDNPKADWYVWYDRPPNNWQSCFDGDAWTYAPERDQYYYHYFMKQQPDLNWHNPLVKQAMWDAVRFWLDMGVDGFRLDALGTIYEDPALTPHSVPMTLAELRHFSETARTREEIARSNRYWREMFKHQWGGPGLHDLMKELRGVLDEYPGDRMLVGEDDDIRYMGDGDDELHLVFNFPLMRAERLTPSHIRRNQRERLARLAGLPVAGWGCNTLGNHDSERVYSRFAAAGSYAAELARLNAALVLTLAGTPFLYNGEEIGMTDLIITDPGRLRDTMATWYYRAEVEDLGADPAEAAGRAGAMSRDKNRTPMQWSRGPNAGFCPPGVEPWLPVNPNYAAGVNVADQAGEPGSLLSYYRRLLRARRASPALLAGEYEPLHERARSYLAFLRKHAGADRAGRPQLLGPRPRLAARPGRQAGRPGHLLLARPRWRAQAGPDAAGTVRGGDRRSGIMRGRCGRTIRTSHYRSNPAPAHAASAAEAPHAVSRATVPASSLRTRATTNRTMPSKSSRWMMALCEWMWRAGTASTTVGTPSRCR